METSKPSNDVFSDDVADYLDPLFEGKRVESRPFGKIKLDFIANGEIMSQTVTDYQILPLPIHSRSLTFDMHIDL